jgi:Fe-S oxidoreductase
MAVSKGYYTSRFESARKMGHLLAPDDLEWAIAPPRGGKAAFLIHLSCNSHYTTFIPYLMQRILKEIGLDTVILGGPENCCGNPHRFGGDPDLEPKVAKTALDGFARMEPRRVLSICPDCDDNFNRAISPEASFSYENVSKIFVEHLSSLKRKMQPVKKRIVVHTHDVNEKRVADGDRMTAILGAIPGIDILPAVHARGPGNHCQVLKPMPQDMQDIMFDEARALGADAVVVPYHSCYRQHCKMEITHGVETSHYVSLLAESLGIKVEERLKDLRRLDDVDAVLSALRPRINNFGYDEAEIRSYIETAIFI